MTIDKAVDKDRRLVEWLAILGTPARPWGKAAAPHAAIAVALYQDHPDFDEEVCVAVYEISGTREELDLVRHDGTDGLIYPVGVEVTLVETGSVTVSSVDDPCTSEPDPLSYTFELAEHRHGEEPWWPSTKNESFLPPGGDGEFGTGDA